MWRIRAAHAQSCKRIRRSRAVQNPGSRQRADRFEAAPRPGALCRRVHRRRLELRHQPRLPAGTRHLLARHLRLARSRAPVEPVRPVQDDHRRRRDSFRASAVEGAERHAAAAAQRVAELSRRVREGHHAAQRELPRRRAVDAGVRILGQAAARPGTTSSGLPACGCS